MSQIDLHPHDFATAPAESIEGDGLWPTLVNIYHEQGYEEGYCRATSDALAAVLESTEDFLRSQPQADPQIRALLYACGEFLEKRLRETARGANHSQFIDGLGI